jgi:hypothetical protein
MAQTQLSKEEIRRRAEERYERDLRDRLEADENNIGKILMLDVESGDYEIDDVAIAASKRLRERHPDGHRYALRIGYDAVYGLGTQPRRSKR